MTANVRCTNANVLDGKAFRTCGWKGERFTEAATDPALPPKERIKDWWPRTVALRTAKPCPRCGGKVELIPTGGDA